MSSGQDDDGYAVRLGQWTDGYSRPVEPLSGAVLAAVAKAVAAKAGVELGKAGLTELKKRVLGDPAEKALARALGRAYASTVSSYGKVLRRFEVNPSFLQFEGAAELAKVLVPGARADAAKLAELHVDSYFAGVDFEARRDYVLGLLPAFRYLLDALREELGRERVLDDVISRVDDAQVGKAMEALVRRAGAAAATDVDQAAYLDWLIDQHRYLRTAGMVSNTTVQILLLDVFVSLSVVRDERAWDRSGDWLKHERKMLETRLESGELGQEGYEAALDRLAIDFGHDRIGRARPGNCRSGGCHRHRPRPEPSGGARRSRMWQDDVASLPRTSPCQGPPATWRQ